MNADATKKAADDRPGEERLLVDHHPAPPAPDAGISWTAVLVGAFLACNLCLAIYRSEGDPAAVGFVAFCYIDLLLLFICIRRFETAGPGSPARRRLKRAVWALSSLLTAVFSFKIAAVMPLPLQILVWVMAASTVGGGFFAFFIWQEGKDG